jgi:hypothetical protein
MRRAGTQVLLILNRRAPLPEIDAGYRLGQRGARLHEFQQPGLFQRFRDLGVVDRIVAKIGRIRFPASPDPFHGFRKPGLLHQRRLRLEYFDFLLFDFGLHYSCFECNIWHYYFSSRRGSFQVAGSIRYTMPSQHSPPWFVSYGRKGPPDLACFFRRRVTPSGPSAVTAPVVLNREIVVRQLAFTGLRLCRVRCLGERCVRTLCALQSSRALSEDGTHLSSAVNPPRS